MPTPANGRRGASAKQKKLLDVVTAASGNAYSTRKLRAAYTGNALQVRRSSDNTTQNIGFTAAGDLDLAALATFVGANSAYVATWYDQSGNARNLTQATAGLQPRLVNAGVVDKKNGRPVVVFDGVDDRLDATTSVTGTTLTGNAVTFVDAGTNGRVLSLSTATNVNDWDAATKAAAILRNAGTSNWYAYRNGALSTLPFTFGRLTTIMSTFDGANHTLRVDGVAGTAVASTGTFAATTLRLGASQAPSLEFLGGGISEAVVWPSALNATDRAAVESSQKAYFGKVPLQRLKTSGRVLVDESGGAVPLLKGFNAQIVPWAQVNFDDMATLGAKFVRQVIFWDAFEPTQGVVDSTMVAALDTQIDRAAAAGLYSMFSFHLNVGRSPAWAVSLQAFETERYNSYGGTLTAYLANRYGNPSSPQYNKAVLGLGLNEPPLDDSAVRNGNNSIPFLEGVQRTMINWCRVTGGAPDWIGFVAFGYGSATPIYDLSFQNNSTNADIHAYDSVGGNVVVDFHDYMVGVTGTPTNGVPASDPTAQVRLPNGMQYPDFQGGPLVGPNQSPPSTYANNATIRAQMSVWIAPYKAFSINANIPLMIGEWGWVPAAVNGNAWITDKKVIWADAGSVIQLQWDFDVTTDTAADPWAAYPNHAWISQTTTWMT